MSDPPRVVTVSARATDDDPAVGAIVHALRRQTDACVFLCGGAATMGEQVADDLLAAFDAFARLAREGVRVLVGDGGTQSGVMAVAGLARRASGDAFPLIGVAPARELAPRGQWPLDPHHSCIVAIEDDEWPGRETWGAETAPMYRLFARLAAGRPSACVIAGGGRGALAEVEATFAARRPLIAVEHSGHLADALVAMTRGGSVADAALAPLVADVRSRGIAPEEQDVSIVRLEDGAAALADALRRAFGRWAQAYG